MIPNAGIPMAGRWGGRASKQAGARDLQLGQISSSELSKFKSLPTKQQYEIARIMDGILADPAVSDAIVASQDAALARLRQKDFGATLVRFVEQVREMPARPAPEVPYDFWPMFDQAERLEELRQFRPAIYRALPAPPAPQPMDHAPR